MSHQHERELSSIERLDDVAQILHSLRRAAADAMLRHKLAGVPVVTGIGDRVVWVDPEDIPIDSDGEELSLRP